MTQANMRTNSRLRLRRAYLALAVYILGLLFFGYATMLSVIDFRRLPLPSDSFELVPFMANFGIILLVYWLVLGAYLALNGRLSDFRAKLVDGFLAGIAVSTLVLLSRSVFVLVKEEVVASWHNDYDYAWVWRLNAPREFGVLLVALFFGWITKDLWRRKFETVVLKILLVSVAFLCIGLFPVDLSNYFGRRMLSLTLGYILAPLFTVAFAVSYYYWRHLRDARTQAIVIAYSVLIVGLVAATVKHWTFFTEELFVGSFSRAELAEVVIDFVVFLFGFLLTFLETTRRSSQSGKANLRPPTVIVDPLRGRTQGREHEPRKPLPLLMLTFVVGLTIGVLAVLRPIKGRRIKHGVNSCNSINSAVT